MNQLSTFLSALGAVTAVLFLSACESNQPRSTPAVYADQPPGSVVPGSLYQGPNGASQQTGVGIYGEPQPPLNPVVQNNTPSPTPTPVVNNPPVQSTSGTGLKPPTTGGGPERIPYATKIANKPGYVISPYKNDLVDVRDPATSAPFTRGTKVTCPYTGKSFLVP